MIISSKPRKQREFRYNAPMHVRQKFIHAHVSKELKEKMGISKRSMPVRKGDTVKVVKGKFKGKTGKVSEVSLRKNAVYIEGISRKKSKGKELLLPISPSNLYLIDLDLSDKNRKAKINSLKSAVKK
ncbi:MAG: 50S ribosomal protein L24 [Candidatus Micrarchaeia archaeon]